MTIHKSTLTNPVACTAGRLIEVLQDMDPGSVVMIAMGQNEEAGLDVAQVHSVTSVKEPLEGVETCLIVPAGAIGAWFEALTEVEAGAEGVAGKEEEPS